MLALRLDTSSIARPLVTLTYLTSYEGMGAVQLACAACACTPATLDATNRQRVSVTHERSVQVTSDAECELRLTLLGKTSSAGQRFKLTRVIVEAQTS